MAVSNTYTFDPTMGDLVTQAFHMCGVRPTELLQEHMTSARMALNLLLGRWSSLGVNTWQVDLQTITLVAGTKTYSVPSDTITMLDTYSVYGSGQSQTNRILTPVSRTEYASYSNPDQQGTVTTYWFNRQLDPEVTFYLVPDGQTQTSVQYWRLRQAMDANYASGGNVEAPYYALEAITAGLAERLSVIWAPDRYQMLKAISDEAYKIFADQNTETANVYVSPTVANYWRP